MRTFLFAIAVSIVAAFQVDATAADPVAWMPAQVNAIARINVAEIYKAPLAVKEGWLKKATESFIQQEAFVPPGTKQILVGAELDLANQLTAESKYTVLVPDAPVTLEKLSAWLPGEIESVSGKPLAHFGKEGYVADVGDGCWLAIGSSTRQTIARWIKTGPMAGGIQLSRYLRNALESKENNFQVTLAIDLQDNFSQNDISEILKATDWFKAKLDADKAAKVLSSVHGITIGISVDTERTGKAVLDFGDDASVLRPALDKLVAEAMERAGVSADDVEGWKWTVKGSQVIGTGPVSPGGARRLISVLDPASISQALSANAAPPELSETERMAQTSLKFSKSIHVLLDDLRAELNKATYNYGFYYKRYARKIDELPTLNVDPMLLDFSGKVSSSLRYQAQTGSMAKINAGTRTAQSWAGGGGYVGSYGNYYSPVGSGIAIGRQNNEAAMQVKLSEWKQIEDGLVVIRRAMTEKYKIQF